MECCAALVVACVACDQRFAFSENTTGTIVCAFQKELADWRLTLPRRKGSSIIVIIFTSVHSVRWGEGVKGDRTFF